MRNASPTDSIQQTAANAIHHAGDTARQLKDDALKGVHETVDAVREAANASIDKAEKSVEKLRSQVDPAVNELAAKAQVLAERSINYCADTSARVREQVEKYTDDATHYVTKQPGKSVVIAAAAGAALTMAAMALLRSRGD
ncbi:MAG: hypothetical protein K2X65_04305 [Burkholderiaceae bacterium]|jgi:ElaB/YqjD/DUF883 family membrane-anchored ribosome-binding protein|nr:hypothetical protein [Burkholderiaceae bacterium]